MNEAQLAGVTPYIWRLASHYACLGVGTYHPRGYAQFDRVEVKILMPWKEGETITESMLVLSVEFYHGPVRLRYVEFSLSPAGFGGKPVIRVIPGGTQ